MRTITTIIITIASVALIGLAINAFAHGGMGWGGGWGYQGGMMHYRGDYGPGSNDQITKEQYEQFEKQREAFFNETRDLRANLYEKERALQAELNQENPNVATASKLQKEISALQAQLDQKRVENMIEMRKIDPDMGHGGYGYMHGGPMMGYGGGHMHGGPMMGYGPGGGYCGY